MVNYVRVIIWQAYSMQSMLMVMLSPMIQTQRLTSLHIKWCCYIPKNNCLFTVKYRIPLQWEYGVRLVNNTNDYDSKVWLNQIPTTFTCPHACCSFIISTAWPTDKDCNNREIEREREVHRDVARESLLRIRVNREHSDKVIFLLPDQCSRTLLYDSISSHTLAHFISTLMT